MNDSGESLKETADRKMEVLSAKCKTGIGFWYLSYFVARVIFRGLSAKSHDICQFSARTNVVLVSCSVSTIKRQQIMLSFLSSNKRSRRVAGKLYKNFRGKQNKGYVLAMEKQPIARNNRLDSSTIADCIKNTWGQSYSSSWNSTWNVFQKTVWKKPWK